MSPFGTLPQYGIDYWPKNAKIIQIEADPRRIGLVKNVDVGINGDCKLASQELLKQVAASEGVHALGNVEERMQKLNDVRQTWETTLDGMTHNQANHKPGTITLCLSSAEQTEEK